MAPEAPASFLHLAGSKLRNKLGAQLNESASQGVTSKFAKSQLEKLGWKEGEGLGKRRQGMSTHIRVTKRADGVGLGESNLDPALQQSIGNEWWKNSVGDTLARLGGKKSKKSSKKEKKEKKTKKKIFTDEELFQATGGARFGMRAQTQQHGKWKRAESNISEHDENEAKNKVEWDGKSAPVLILKDEKKKKKSKKRDREEAVSDASDEKTSSDDTKERKKRKKEKKEKVKEIDESQKKKKSSKKKKKKET